MDYYPFGMIMPGRHKGSTDYRFGYNGKEKDNEVKGEGNSLDFGARIYDTRVGRWMALDPLQRKYPQLSPYNYAGNSPIYCYDPDGKKIMVQLSNGNLVEYKPGIKPVNEDKILQQIHEAVSYVMQDDPNHTFEQLSASPNTVIIANIDAYHKEDMTEPCLRADQRGYDADIFWDPTSGLRMANDDGTPTTDGGAQTPASNLKHEGDHALRILSIKTASQQKSFADDVKPDNTRFDNKEDKRDIQQKETPYIKAKNAANGPKVPKGYQWAPADDRIVQQQEATRDNHRGRPYHTAGPTSITPAPGTNTPVSGQQHVETKGQGNSTYGVESHDKYTIHGN